MMPLSSRIKLEGWFLLLFRAIPQVWRSHPCVTDDDDDEDIAVTTSVMHQAAMFSSIVCTCQVRWIVFKPRL